MESSTHHSSFVYSGVVRMAELSHVSGLPAATIKWYLRIGLLHAGTATAPNQAQYDGSHIHRLRLVRALLEVAGLSVANTRRLVEAMDDPGASLPDVLAAAHAATSRAPTGPVPADTLVDAYIRSRGWIVSDDAPARGDLAAVLTAMQALTRLGGEDRTPAADTEEAVAALLDPYAAAVEPLAAAEIGGLPPAAPREVVVERVVLGTLLMEQALGALRRLAQEHEFGQDTEHRRDQP